MLIIERKACESMQIVLEKSTISREKKQAHAKQAFVFTVSIIERKACEAFLPIIKRMERRVL